MNAELASDFFRLFPERHVLVIGDLLLDEYLWGHVQRISAEAPVPILNIANPPSYALGGAGNVASNLRALGGRVTVISAIGEDSTASQITQLLTDCGTEAKLVREADRRTSRKTRLMSLEHGQQVFRFDEESTDPVRTCTEDALLAHLQAELPSANAVLCSDYKKGVLTERVLQGAIRGARERGLPIVIAPKDSNARKYKGASILVPNLTELMQLAGTSMDSASSLVTAAAGLIKDLELESIVVTRGREGISLFEKLGESVSHTPVGTVAKAVYDVTGAGDTFVSMFTLAIAAGANHKDAAWLGNTAAGIVVGKRGTATVTIDELDGALREQAV